jgi:hypothetical protein
MLLQFINCVFMVCELKSVWRLLSSYHFERARGAVRDGRSETLRRLKCECGANTLTVLADDSAVGYRACLDKVDMSDLGMR